jgi:predicted sugar kinase
MVYPYEIIYKLENLYEHHVGLGSQTQAKLSLTAAILKLYGIKPNYTRICEELKMCRVSAV